MSIFTRVSRMSLPLLALMVPVAASAGEGPSLMAHVNGVRAERSASKALAIADMDVRVKLRGTIAETEITARFANPSRDTLEGDFALDMPSGSVVTGYALDINGTLVDGVLESRYKAQEAYARRVAVRVDPGIAEVDYSDRFTTRIFPIFPGAGRTVRLRFVTPLDPAKGYVLPLTLAGPVGQLRLGIDAGGAARSPQVTLPKGLTGNFEDGQLRVAAQQVRLDGTLTIVPMAASPLVVSEQPGEGRFFELTGNLATLPPSGAKAAAAHVFWDRSVSRSDDALERERSLLGDWLRARAVQKVSVTLFDSNAPETHADLTPAAALALIAAQHYRGGTSYAGLAQVKVAPRTPCLLFSDGRNTIDAVDGVALPCAARAVTSGPEADRAFLAELTGNAPVELTADNQAAALSQLVAPGSPVASLHDENGRAVDHVPLDGGAGGWRLVGKLPTSGALVLTLASGEVRRFQATSVATPMFAGPGALWASRRLAGIGDDAGPDERIAFARRFSVANPQAAFVVLETPEDYARSEIEPPQSYPKELRPRYDAARAALQRDKDARQDMLGKRLRTEWASLVKWWETKFDPDAKPKPAKRGDRGDAVASAADASADGAESIVVTSSARADDSPRPRRLERMSAPVAPPPPPPPPPPVAAMAAVSGAQATQAAAAAPEPAAGGSGRRAGSIAVEPWSSDRPYVARLAEAGANYEAEIDSARAKYGAIPLFWFDVAEWHFQNGRKAEAARAALAALDLPTRDNQTLQIVASRLLRYGEHDRAIRLLERLVQLETDRPQPRRTLALALIERARTLTGEARRADLKRALTLLEEAIGRDWPDQYRGFHMIALVEANRLIAELGGREASGTKLDKALVKAIDAGVRVSAEWNTPRTDIDLWVREPRGEDVGYSNQLSAQGGRYNADVTQGYGPEEYMLRLPMPGSYTIRAKTFAADRNNPNGPSTLTVRVIYDFGRPNERQELVTVEMQPDNTGMRQIAEVTVGKPK